MKTNENQKSTNHQPAAQKPFFGAAPDHAFFSAEKAESTPFFQPKSISPSAIQAKSATSEAEGIIQSVVQRMPAFESEVNDQGAVQRKLFDSLQQSSASPIQAKLTIGEPGDKYEQEADRVASQVVEQINAPASAQSTQGQSLQRQEEKPEQLQAKPEITTLQRMEEKPEELQAKSILQRGIAGGEASPDLASAINSARGSGKPLDTGLQRSMGQAMGADFSGVRVHTDTQSDQLNRSIQAKSFTTGQDVFFRQGAYEPGSQGGQELIAHELTHVVQQKQGDVRLTKQFKDGIPSNDAKGLEYEADVMGAKTLQMKPKVNNSRLVVNSIIQKKSNTVQRAIIPHGPIDGLNADIDTANVDASKAQIDEMWNGGKRQGLAALYVSLVNAKSENYPKNNKRLQDYIDKYLKKQAKKDPEAGVASIGQQTWFDLKNPAGDETGITERPGIGEILPTNATPQQTYALYVRSWQIGDIVDQISWSTLGLHLQGRMDIMDYIRLGEEVLGYRDLKNGTNLLETATGTDLLHLAKQALNRVRNEIRVGLDGLPKRDGVSYRAATAAVGVYGTRVNVGDYIMDKSFWSTSALKLEHRGQKFGGEGTVKNPKVYYIITGSTGVFLPKYTNKEVGVREVLFKDQTIFKVNKITNYADQTFFVYVTETDPNTLSANQVTKNPWSGTNNR